MSLLKGESKFNFVGSRGTFAKVSSVLVAGSIIALVLLIGGLIFGGFMIIVDVAGHPKTW